ncbi:hypothetical protein KB553_13350 [Chryseobacterium rhizoplanae]|uniref:hypothetical protein n=1 Tax=Chryseobacterium rhizoplanae TaxID=1609531 RepID=UPI001CE29A34|nr:hypothetical protein [Chryseobacterium rhizoplanae]UCA58040.1 hypothetical protein KB553_13350 [Chryseobacterium rhizoplanae]
MRNGLTILGIFAVIFSCKAQQQVYPLNTYPENVPVNSYFKDLNNELTSYIGIYRANFQGKEITLLYY